MVDLLMIADDFTGALDAGVRYVEAGIPVSVATDVDYDFGRTPDGVRVLVIAAETRHESPDTAYRIVKQIAERAVQAGITYFYKKTDSALRGNVGAELQAMLDGTGKKRIHFVPALPDMNRITVNGVHYIDGKPVAKSVFGQDPFEPVDKSRVADILAEQTDVPVWEETPERIGTGDGICVYDAKSEEDLLAIAGKLKEKEELELTAGCAGFAGAHPFAQKLKGKINISYRLEKTILTGCGSINPITREQLAEAENSGFLRIFLEAEQKANEDWIESGECRELVERWSGRLQRRQDLILDANDRTEGETRRYAQSRGLDTKELRVRISNTLGQLLKKLLDKGIRATLILTGGDTLLAFMKQIRVAQLKPLCEIVPGAVLSEFEYKEKHYHVISKSGGFGQKTFFAEISKKIKGQEEGKC